MRIPVTTHPDHICLHKKDLCCFFSENELKIKGEYPQHHLVSYDAVLYLLAGKLSFPLTVYSCPYQRTEIHISDYMVGFFDMLTPKNVPGNLHGAVSAMIGSGDKKRFFVDSMICVSPHVTMTQSDAEEFGFYQGKKISLELPYKGIFWENVPIKVKDYFALDFFVMGKDAEKLGVITHDRVQPA